MLKIAFNDNYIYPLEENHRFPMIKYELIPEQLIRENTCTSDNFFKPKKNKKKHFSIVIPPPNVTGNLHMGHALNNSLQEECLTQLPKMVQSASIWSSLLYAYAAHLGFILYYWPHFIKLKTYFQLCK